MIVVLPIFRRNKVIAGAARGFEPFRIRVEGVEAEESERCLSVVINYSKRFLDAKVWRIKYMNVSS